MNSDLAHRRSRHLGRERTRFFESNKCTYPKCTLCVDECLMNAIDFSKDPPVSYGRCEGCDLCWCICPEGAIDIPNVAEVHQRQGWWYKIPGVGPPPMPEPEQREADSAESLSRRRRDMPRFRQLIPDEEVGVAGQVMFDTNVPRIKLNKKDWPYEIDGGKKQTR